MRFLLQGDANFAAINWVQLIHHKPKRCDGISAPSDIVARVSYRSAAITVTRHAEQLHGDKI
jgi:hypothetical protein